MSDGGRDVQGLDQVDCKSVFQWHQVQVGLTMKMLSIDKVSQRE